jgi:ABC-type uncharacterized transport system substrate-binding protein
MRRREFITLIGGTALAWPLGAHAQQAVKLHRIGILSPEPPAPGFLEAFKQGLRELGYVEGQDIAFEVRSADGDNQRLAALANQLVEVKVDVIVAINTSAVQAAKKASATIPIVMTRIVDPVKSGLVRSLSRPGGNITGWSGMADELSGKRLELLKEVFPNVSRVAVLWYEPNPGADIAAGAMKAASREAGFELLLLPVHGQGELIGAFETAIRGQVQALIVIDDEFATQHRVEILNLAAAHSLAVVSQYKIFAEAGALFAYGPSPSAMYSRTAYYVDRILKGANAGDLPVEQPTKFDLVINLKTAKALGLTVSREMQMRADELIE